MVYAGRIAKEAAGFAPPFCTDAFVAPCERSLPDTPILAGHTQDLAREHVGDAPREQLPGAAGLLSAGSRVAEGWMGVWASN